MSSSNSPEKELRRHFAAVYLTLISILVALAVEGLLERLAELPSLSVLSQPVILAWLQISIVLLIAALFWWVIARWASTLPWAFGFFDALAPLILLMVLHFLAHSVGTSAERWFAALGVVAIGGSVNYFYSATRALSFSSQPPSQGALLAPTGIIAGTGLIVLAGSGLGLGSPSVGVRIFLNAVVIGIVVAFAVTEYRFWNRAVRQHLDGSSAA